MTADFLMELFSLEGRVGIITGAAGGIGFKTANVLANAGAKVYSLDLTTTPEKGITPHENIIFLKCDITNILEMEEIIKKIGDKEGIDFLINNAGITKKERAEKFCKDTWKKIHEINVDAVFNMSTACYPYLKESATVGRIINISSMAAHLGFSGVVPYCSSKSAVTGITRGLSVEWAKDNILVNSVAPGWIYTKMTETVKDEDRIKKILSRMSLGKYGSGSDIGNMILYLVSNAGSYITGQDIAVDGGALALGY